MKTLFRRLLRTIIKYLCIIAINKHSLEIVAVGGWYGTDIGREAVYTILKQNGKKVRRILHSPEVDWDIPLTILGIRSVPGNYFSWVYTIILTIGRLIWLKPNPSLLILQINTHDAGIMKYWMSFIHPTVVIMLNSHAGTLNLELLLTENLKESGQLILNNDNVRTKSLAQGRMDHVLYFGEYKEKKAPDFYFNSERLPKTYSFWIGHGTEVYPVQKDFPEFTYPVLTGCAAISSFYTIPLTDACAALTHFELPSAKIQQLFHKFIDE